MFLEWRYEGCVGNASPTIELIYFAADGSTTVLTDGISISEDNDVTDGLAHYAQRRFAVSPDGSHIAWLSGTRGNGQLNVTDITSGETIVLHESKNINDDVDQFIGFGTVLWLPS